MQRRGGVRARGVALAPALFVALAACSPGPNASEPVDDTTDGGLSAYGEDGFQCPAPITNDTCCGSYLGCAPSFDVAASCATVAVTPSPYILDTSPCEGFYEAQQGTTFFLFDQTSGTLAAILQGPGPNSAGFSCLQGPVALAVGNDCLEHWQVGAASGPCIDAGSSPLSVAGCQLDAQAE
jgi:hypothetical protein